MEHDSGMSPPSFLLVAVVGVVEESRPWKQWQTYGGREAEATEAEEEEDEEEWGADGAAVVVADVVMAAVAVLLM